MKKILFFLLAAIAPLAVQAQVNIMSFNIRYGTASDGTNSWRYRAGAVLKMIEDQAPDVIGMQEALNEQVRFLDEFTNGYDWVGVGRDDGRKDGEYVAIFYNKKRISLLKWGTFWLSETPDKPSLGWDAACRRTATWAFMKDKKTGRKFLMVNTHLDHVGEQARDKGAALILEKISSINKQGIPVVLTGDMNSTSADKALQHFEANLLNARANAVSSDLGGTFHDWGKVKSPDAIDHIYYRGWSSCTRFEVVRTPYEGRTFVSDHYPIKATLVF